MYITCRETKTIVKAGLDGTGQRAIVTSGENYLLGITVDINIGVCWTANGK